MKFVIAKVTKGHWHYYVARGRWSPHESCAMLLDSPQDAWVHIDLMPDGDEIGAAVLYAEIVVCHEVFADYQKPDACASKGKSG